MSTLDTPSSSSAPSVPPDVRPLGIGELIDRAAHGWRRHFGTLFRLYLAVQLCVFMAGKAFELSMAKWFPLVRGGKAMAQAIDEGRASELIEQYALFFGFGIPLTLLSSWLASVVGTAASWFFIRQHLGQPATIADSIARMKARLGTLTGAFVLAIVWALGAGFLCLLPGAAMIAAGVVPDWRNEVPGLALLALGMIVLALGLLAAFLIFLVRFLFLPQVIAMEDVGAREAMKRSGQLISGRVGPAFLDRVKVRATLLLTLASAILVVVTLTAGIPASILQFVYAQPFDPVNANPDAIPQALLIPAQLLQTLVQAAFSPLFMVVSALFYVDMRVRREGLDLELKLGA